MKQRGAKIKLFKGERLLFLMLFIMIISTPVLIVFSKATLTKTNIEVEKLKSKIAKQTGLNESLYMKINELASLDNIQDVAKAEGLSYNNSNIKTISNN